MEAASRDVMLVFADGPAEDERVHINVEPQPVRWYCESAELGSDDLHGWWSLEEPLPDDSITVTRYELLGEIDDPDIEGDARVYRYGISAEIDAPEDWEGYPEVPEGADRLLSALRSRLASSEEIPVARFRDADIRAVMIDGTWHQLATPGEMSQVVIQTDAASLAIGPCLCFLTGEGQMLVPPTAVQAFRASDSTVAATPEVRGDAVYVNRAVYGDDGETLDQGSSETIAEAETVVVVEPTGRETVVKERG